MGGPGWAGVGFRASGWISEVFVKIKKKNISGGGGRQVGGQGGCERRSEVFVKNSKKNQSGEECLGRWGGGGGGEGRHGRGVRVYVNEEVKFL